MNVAPPDEKVLKLTLKMYDSKPSLGMIAIPALAGTLRRIFLGACHLARVMYLQQI
jgi:hypothetical protein